MEIVSHISKKRIDGNIYPIEYISSNQKSKRLDTNSDCDFVSCVLEIDSTISKHDLSTLTPSVLTTSK